MNYEPSPSGHTGEGKKSLVQRFLLVLSLALPIVILIAGVLIIRASNLLPGAPPLQRYIIAGLFITYAMFRIYQVIIRNRPDQARNMDNE